ncbi:MAG: carboxymuconolactone decarboxylase family protein [Proteobacteria bacterium]|nr:carboxymuconolactone decarboxylase family protein [Pseudomonadota bacterium]
MQASSKEPQYLKSEADAASKSLIASQFLKTRSNLNQIVNNADNNFVKRFYNLDHNSYMEGSLTAQTKELMGLSVSAALRCDDCINYHIIQSWRLGATKLQQEESINIALIIGGSIVIPHLRRAYALLAELYSDPQ